MKFNALIPELSVTDIAKSLDFYINVLGFKCEYDRPNENFSFLSIDDAQLMLEQRNGNWETASLSHPFGRGINFQIEVSDIDSILTRLNRANYKLFKEPKEEWYKVDNHLRCQKQSLIMDPDGYLLRFCQPLETKI